MNILGGLKKPQRETGYSLHRQEVQIKFNSEYGLLEDELQFLKLKLMMSVK